MKSAAIATIIGGVFILAMIPFAIYGRLDAVRISPAAQDVQGGCASCHTKLSATVPEGHSTVMPDQVQFCLICHSLQGPAPAFDWVIHLTHYAQSGFVGNCWSCHLIDQSGSFKLIGGEAESQIRVTKDVVQSMSSYFQSWATSERLDHKHAEQGVTCASCHGTFFPVAPPSMEQCLNCHGSYQYIATLSADVYPNPHASHWGDLPCGDCHGAHQESVLFCDDCHSWDLRVP